jgi:hypothetical protein
MKLSTNHDRTIARFITDITKFLAASVKLSSGLDMAHSDLLVMAGKSAPAVTIVENVWTNVPPISMTAALAGSRPLIQQPATHNR